MSTAEELINILEGVDIDDYVFDPACDIDLNESDLEVSL